MLLTPPLILKNSLNACLNLSAHAPCCRAASAQLFSGPLSGGKGFWNIPWELQKTKFFQADQHRRKYFLLFSWAGRKWSGKIVRSKHAWFKRYIMAVSLFSVSAAITSSPLKEQLVQRVGADLTQLFSSCFMDTVLNDAGLGEINKNDNEGQIWTEEEVCHPDTDGHYSMGHSSDPYLGFCTACLCAQRVMNHHHSW